MVWAPGPYHERSARYAARERRANNRLIHPAVSVELQLRLVFLLQVALHLSINQSINQSVFISGSVPIEQAVKRGKKGKI